MFVFLACWEIGGRNIVNDLSDLESDAGRRHPHGRRRARPAAAARAAVAVAATCLVAVALLPMPVPAVVLALAFGVWSLAWPAVDPAARPDAGAGASYFNHGSPYPDLVLFAALVGSGLARA